MSRGVRWLGNVVPKTSIERLLRVVFLGAGYSKNRVSGICRPVRSMFPCAF